MSWWFPGLSHFQIFHLNAGAEFPISASLGGHAEGGPVHFGMWTALFYPYFYIFENTMDQVWLSVCFSLETWPLIMPFTTILCIFFFLFFLEWLGLWLGIICQREHGYFCALSFLFRFQNQMPTSYFIQSSKLKAWVLTKWNSIQLYLLRITSLTLK